MRLGVITLRREVESIDLRRIESESPLEHHKRLVYGKLVDKTLSDCDYSEIAEVIYGQPYSSDVARRMLYGSRKTLEVMDAERIARISDTDVRSDIDAQIIELRKERQKFYDYRNAFAKAVRDRSREEELNEIIIQAVQV